LACVIGFQFGSAGLTACSSELGAGFTPEIEAVADVQAECFQVGIDTAVGGRVELLD
jgi:hypothetical protein